MKDISGSDHWNPHRICPNAEITSARVSLGVPRGMRGPGYIRNQIELIDAVAEKVDGPNAQAMNFIKAGRIEMRVVEVTEEQIEGLIAMRLRHLIDNLLCQPCSIFPLWWREMRTFH